LLRHVTAPDGVRLACEVAGAGPPLVMVHGAGSARWSFALVRPQLESRFTVWAFDRRGRGDSGDGDGTYELDREVEDVAAVLRAAGAGAGLFAHSYGALLSAAAAARVGGLPRLVLYEGPQGGVLADEDWTARFEANVEAGDRDAAISDFMSDVGGYSDEEIEAMRRTPVWEARMRAAHTVPRELRAEHALDLERVGLDALETPTLLLVGSRSPDWARRSTQAYAATLPNAKVHTLDGQGHGAATGAPELLASEILGFAAGA
jgi:pimeloyl-ACP methyl ester carboxylesterase